MIWTKRHILHLLQMFSVSNPGFSPSLHLFWKVKTSSACAGFLLSIKRRTDWRDVDFLLSLSKLYCFGFYENGIKYFIVPEIYLTQDVPSIQQ